MKNIMQKAFINLFLVFLSVSVCGLFATDAKAYNRYNDGCQNCHGSFSDGFSPKGTPFDYHENNKQEMHRNPYAMATDCALCHTSGDKDNPYIGNSSGHQGDFDVGCVGCHGREEDAGNDSISPGRGAGLRQHHWNADVIVETESGPVSSQVCADCHTDTKPQQYTPVGEQVKPSYYGSDHTNADGPCNLIAQHETNENWDHYDFEGLDNDGDGLYDGNDPDCFPDTLTVVENVAPATNVEPGESGIEMQRLEVQCSNDGNGNCIIVSVSVNDTQISNEGVIDSLEVHIDDDMKMRNGTLGRVTISNWDGEPTVADMTSIPFEDRTLDNNNNNNEKYIFLIYNLTASSDGSSIQSQVTAIDVASPDNGSSGTWSSNRITIGGPSCSDNDNDGYSPDGGSCGPLDCNDNDNAVHPAAQEVCDGLDNDCNGTADDITPQATTCGIGECSSTGQTTCIGGVEGDTCTPGTPSAEVCDNLDNDCDGAIDENLTRSTTCGIGECASSGEETCTAGTWGNDTCSPGTPGTEGPDGNVTCTDTLDNDCDGTTDGGDSDCTPTCVPTGVPETVCNDVDDDCDGQVDEDFTPTATSCGVGECSSTGQTTCVGGVEGDTCTPGTPSAELCDNLDNDCDGVVDDFTRSTTCGVGECGSTGVETCTAGVWGGDTCTPGAPSAELCDNLDNNCDGSIDENLTQPTSCGVGECSGNTGIETCTTGTWDNDTCDPFAGATAEVCDNLDNNCDGAVDENLTQATTCGVGECSGNTGTETCTAGTWGGDTCDPFGGANPEGPYGDLTCGDLSDNDCDGYTDTADSDCEVQCSDYTDKQSCNNDSNCKWDKQQEVCIDNPSGCTPAQEGPSGDATCSDGSDNDCDDLVDGNDPDCTQTEGNCFDGLDDDNDGLTDCVDSDCDGATGGSCTTGQPGICSTGTRTLVGRYVYLTTSHRPRCATILTTTVMAR
jgi:hypothetical protein